MISQDEQLIAQARAAHARAMKCSDIAHEGMWVAREGWREPPGSHYWQVTATRSPRTAGVEPYTVSKALTQDPDVAALLTFVSTALPQLCDRLDAAQARIAELEAERDEAIKDRNGHADHVLRMAQECSDGLAALDEIDACWDACGLPGNRGKLSLSEQVSALSRDLDAAKAQLQRARALLQPFGRLAASPRLRVLQNERAIDVMLSGEGGFVRPGFNIIRWINAAAAFLSEAGVGP